MTALMPHPMPARAGKLALLCTLAGLAAWLPAGPARAQGFQESITAAQRFDPTFQVALTNVANRRLQSREARAAFFPSASVNYTRADIATSGASYGVSITQPLLSYDRYLTLQQVDPIAALAVAEERQARNDLALRLFRVMADIVRNREAIRANGVQIESLETQLRRAQRMRELGQGTVTEISDYEVRVAVAQANRVSLQSALDSGLRNFALLTGLQGSPERITVDDAVRGGRPPEEAGFVARVRETTTAVVSARQSLRLQEIAGKRVNSEYLPQVVAVAGTGRSAGAAGSYTDTRVSIVLSAPLGAGQLYNRQRAANDLLRAQENLRSAQETSAIEAQRLLRSAQALESEVLIRERAVEVARQALDGNIRSFQGGVKSNIDVLTSIQNLSDTQVALANSRVARVEALLSIELLDPEAAR